MSTFCTVCNNILIMINTPEVCYNKCNSCANKYSISDVDTLRFEESKGTNFSMYKMVLYNAGQDPVNPKARRDCKKCKNDMVRQVRIPDSMEIINVCTNIDCNEKWNENS